MPDPSQSNASPRASEPGNATADQLPTPAPSESGTEVDLQRPLSEVIGFLAPPLAPNELGRLGDFRILRKIGQGGMGYVFEGIDAKLDRTVAIKLIRPEVAALPDAKSRFLREAKTAAGLSSDFVVVIHQVDEFNGLPFLVMPMMQGQTLHDRLKRGPRLEIREIIQIGKETALGLAAAHAAGLIHRDIKPANLWLEANEIGSTDWVRTKILDFGLARSMRAGDQLTRSGQVLGTPHYMSPEQARGQALDGRSDLFSLGCVLYRLTTGREPFSGRDVLEVLYSLATSNPPAPSAINRNVPRQLSQLILSLIAKDAIDRPRSAAAVAERLSEIGGKSPFTAQKAQKDSEFTAARHIRIVWNKNWGMLATHGAFLVFAILLLYWIGTLNPFQLKLFFSSRHRVDFFPFVLPMLFLLTYLLAWTVWFVIRRSFWLVFSMCLLITTGILTAVYFRVQ